MRERERERERRHVLKGRTDLSVLLFWYRWKENTCLIALSVRKYVSLVTGLVIKISDMVVVYT